MREKITNLNLLRFISAISIFLYHCICNTNCDYGIFNYIFHQSSFFMTLFFILSGFVLFYSCADTNFENIEEIKKYLHRRICSIFPIYFLIWGIFLVATDTDAVESIVTFPFQFSLLQNFSHYNYLTNSGAWFFSCIFICYLVFPYLCLIVRQLKGKSVFGLMAFCFVLTCFVPFLINYPLHVNSYYNAFVRLWEFAIGIMLGRIFIEHKAGISSRLSNALTFLVFLFTFWGIFLLKKYVPAITLYQENLKSFSVVFGTLLIYFTSVSDSRLLDRLGKSKLVSWGSAHSLEIWCATFFSTPLTNFIANYLEKYSANTNMARIIISLILNILITILLGYYGKLSKYIIKRISLKKYLVCVAILLVSINGVKACMQYCPLRTYDFEKNHIDTSSINGIYADEGECAWIDNNCKINLLNNGTNKIVLKAGSLNAESFFEEIYIDGKFVEEIEIYPGINNYEILVPDEFKYDLIWSLELKSEYSFIPAAIYENSTDTRELTMQLYCIGSN